MLGYLTQYFKPSEAESARSLRLGWGEDGSKLTHSHSTHYTYVLQSLTLWLSITQQMFALWMAADRDLLGRNEYRLWNTGQGLNRVRACTALCCANIVLLACMVCWADILLEMHVCMLVVTFFSTRLFCRIFCWFC